MKRLLSTALVLALSGCALMEPGPEPVAALNEAKLGLTGQAVAWPETKWWQRYGDSQLDTLMDEALANSPSMTAAQARLAKANAAVSTARAPLMPRVDANYTLNREHLSADYIYPAPLGGSVVSENRLALDFSYELDFWGKNRSHLKAAVSQQAAAEADAQAARNVLASATVRAYLNLQDAFAQRDVIKRVLAQREEVLSLTRGRYSAGLDTQVEVKQAESSLAAGQVDDRRARAFGCAAGQDGQAEDAGHENRAAQARHGHAKVHIGQLQLPVEHTFLLFAQDCIPARSGTKRTASNSVRFQLAAPVRSISTRR